jgi:hypothetical protein
MTFDEACELARVIEGTSRFSVMAIGRFELQAELSKAHAGGFLEKLPWGVSVFALDSPDYPKVLRSEEQWREFVACASPPASEPVKLTQTQAASGAKAPAAQGMFEFV